MELTIASMQTETVSEVAKLVGDAKRVVVIQADNPDGDSLASALALEQILGDMGKQAFLYCGADIPGYLRHLEGWDRVSTEMPKQFDLSIIVDTSALSLLEKLESSEERNWVASRPVIVIDHHSGVSCDIPYATAIINDNEAVSVGEVIYKLAKEFDWPLNPQAKSYMASSILSDSLGLTSEGTTATTYRVMADLIEGGVDRPALEEARRALTKMPEKIFRYKATLIERTEFFADSKIALVTVPQNEIIEYSPLYNPGALIQIDMLQTEGVRIAIVLKSYDDGRITGALRCNNGTEIAAELAQAFGGGGHVYAAGFKVTDGRPLSEVKADCITKAAELLDNSDG